MLNKLSEADCRAAMRDGDFETGIRASAPRVVIALTQSWCPQWTRVRPLLEELAGEEGAACFFVEYDMETFFEAFMSFKESVFRNDQVPYLRYYRNGRLYKETNYVDRSTFRMIASFEPAQE